MLRTTISVAGILLAGAIFFFYTQPSYDTAQGVQIQIASYNEALKKAGELQQLKQQLLSRFNAFNPADIERLQKLLPDHVDNIRLILDMDNIAARHAMTLSNVDISGNNSKAAVQTVIGSLGASSRKFDSLTLGFSTTGTYANFKLFLRDLESSLRIVDIASLTISPSGGLAQNSPGGAPEPVYTFAISLKTYWLK